MEKEFGIFRKAAFGGFNRKDVIDYIEKMKNETFEYKKQVELTMSELNNKIYELESAARFADEVEDDAFEGVAPVIASGESVGDIKAATEHLRAVADELCRSLSDFIEKLNRKGLYTAETVPSVEETAEVNSVDGILSAMSFMFGEGNKTEEAPAARNETAERKIGVEKILEGFSFLS